jgi:hypothetical protein
LLFGSGQVCTTLPTAGRDVIILGHSLKNMEFFTEFHWKKLKWSEIEEIETREKV